MSLHLFPLTRRHFFAHYHGRYVHAKKLFVFDLALLAAVFGLIGLTIYLFVYDPTVRRAITVTVDTPVNRFQSGDKVPLVVTYKNKSAVTLKEARLHIDLPPGFLPETTSTEFKKYILIDTIKPGESGGITIPGTFYTEPESPTNVPASLSYRQETREEREEKIGVGIFTSHGSTIDTKISIASTTTAQGDTPFNLSITNNSDLTAPQLRVSIYKDQGTTIDNLKSETGSIEAGQWNLPSLPPHGTAEIKGIVHFANPNKKPIEAKLTFVPEIILAQKAIPQVRITRNVTVLPQPIQINVDWEDASYGEPSSFIQTKFSIQNISGQTLNNLVLTLPLPEALVQISRFMSANKNIGTMAQQIFTIHFDSPLRPDETKIITLQIPIADFPNGGTDISLTLLPRLSGTFSTSPETIFSVRGESTPLPIGTTFILNGEARYFTPEGDQIGRGPLPPTVGRETKYWVIISLKNSTSQISPISFGATLAPNIRWTGKTSVSLGQNISYNETTRRIEWQAGTIDPHDSVQISMELGYTPKQSDIGLTAPLLNNISATGFDTYTNRKLTNTLPTIDTSLSADTEAKKQGILVTE
jgi:hypothetical protein